jgi:hypothetical protein
VQHLHALCVLDFRMLLYAHRFREVRMNELSHYSPRRVSMHPEDMVALGNDPLADFIRWSVAGHGATFVKDLLGDPSVAYNNRCCWTKFEREQPAVLFGPFGKSVQIDQP